MKRSAEDQNTNVMIEPLNTKALLRRFGIRPDKRLGQNFLIDPGALRKVVDAADLTGGETVLEIGAGLGALTLALSHKALQVIAIEFDRRLLPALEWVVRDHKNVEIIAGDILRIDLTSLVGDGPYRVVANIPYNITSAVIRRLMEAPQKADRAVLTVQREVAERIISGPGSMSLLALSVQLYGSPQISARISSEAFYPRPKVDSAVLQVHVHQDPMIPGDLISPFFRVAKAGFSQKRKQLRNSLAGGLGVRPKRAESWLEAAGIQPRSRAQELDIEAWGRLALIVVEDALDHEE
jgi:16S rRNA (adenine1518-N6/adenine1519-N6)-dimethyltransferase